MCLPDISDPYLVIFNKIGRMNSCKTPNCQFVVDNLGVFVYIENQEMDTLSYINNK